MSDVRAWALLKPCPACSHVGLTMTYELRALPLGTWSLAGAQLKTSAKTVAVVTCDACGTSTAGYLDGATFDQAGGFTGGHFVADGPPRPPQDTGEWFAYIGTLCGHHRCPRLGRLAFDASAREWICPPAHAERFDFPPAEPLRTAGG